jgi:hypothetical protein
VPICSLDDQTVSYSRGPADVRILRRRSDPIVISLKMICLVISVFLAAGRAQAQGDPLPTPGQVPAANDHKVSPCFPAAQIGVPPKSAAAQNAGVTAEPGPETSAKCAAAGDTHRQPNSADEEDDSEKLFDASERVEVQLPEKLTLAEAARIPLRIHASGLTTLMALQTQHFSGSTRGPDFVNGSNHTLQILHSSDGSSYITIVPMRLGNVELDLTGRFRDGGLIRKKVTLNVEPTLKRPKKFIVAQRGMSNRNAERVLMSMTGGRTGNALFLFATYDDIDEPIEINPAFAALRIIAQDQPSPVQLNQNSGWIEALHTGQALIEVTFGDRVNLTCVDVEQELIPNQSYFHNDCHQLLPVGEKLGTVN